MNNAYFAGNLGARIGGTLGGLGGAIKGATSQGEIDPMTGQRKRVGIAGRAGRVLGNSLGGTLVGGGAGYGLQKGGGAVANRFKNRGIKKVADAVDNAEQLSLAFSRQFPAGVRANFRHTTRYLANF